MTSISGTARMVAGLLACLALTACGDRTGDDPDPSYGGKPFDLPVGPTEWDVTQPAWYYEGTLHVGDRSVELGGRVDEFALGATGVYWMRQGTLMFTSAEGGTEKVEDVGWGNIAVSADRSVFATVDQSRGPTDRYDTHVIQLAVFDTRTGEQLYRTPDEEPDKGADLADLYGEIMPLLHGVSNERVFFDDATIHLDDGSSTPVTEGEDYVDVYEGLADTLFPDGYHIGVRGEGRRRQIAESDLYGIGRLSPDRSTIFDVGQWPTDAVAYDAETGLQREIDAPWDHFSLAGWTDEDTFFGVAQRIDMDLDSVLQEQQVVTCEVDTLACTPVSPVIPPVPLEDQGRWPVFLMENNAHLL